MNLENMLEEIEARAKTGVFMAGAYQRDIPKLIAALRMALYYVEGDATYEILCTRMAAILQPNDSEAK